MKLKVNSLADLANKAQNNAAYQQLAIVAANNLGGQATNLSSALLYLRNQAYDSDESGVVDEVNFCADLVE